MIELVLVVCSVFFSLFIIIKTLIKWKVQKHKGLLLTSAVLLCVGVFLGYLTLNYQGLGGTLMYIAFATYCWVYYLLVTEQPIEVREKSIWNKINSVAIFRFISLVILKILGVFFWFLSVEPEEEKEREMTDMYHDNHNKKSNL
jgi:hypothetical protein